jgi:hypothetical protein
LFLPTAMSSGSAEEASSPRLAMHTRSNGLSTLGHAPLAASDLGQASQLGWLASWRVEKAGLPRVEARTPCWAWCTLGVMSLTILGLFSFGWHDWHFSEGSEGTVLLEERRMESSRQPDAPIAPAPRRGINGPKLSGGDPPSPAAMRPGHSVCIGICAGGDVWTVACGA